MAQNINWTEIAEETFGDMDKTPWIKIPENSSFTGLLKLVKGGFTNNLGNKYTEIWFDDNGIDRHLDASQALMKQFIEANPQENDTVRISRARELAIDKEGNPIMGQNPESGNEEQKSFTRYKVEILDRAGSEPAKTESAPVKKSSSKKEVQEDVDLNDLPF